VVTIEVLRSVLEFAIDGLVEILHDPGARRFCSLEVRVNIVDEHGQALSFKADLRRTGPAGSNSVEHDPSLAEMHLRTTDRAFRVAVAVMLDESECGG